jgi:hypothetical protein
MTELRSLVLSLVSLLALATACESSWAGDAGVGLDLPAADAGPMPGRDTDGDGLDDAWEFAAGDPALLDWQNADSDGDGFGDGLEDPDQDGLDNLDEYAASRLRPHRPALQPHPLRRDLLVELDSMVDRHISDEVLDSVMAIYAALPLGNPDGSSGVQVLFHRDQQDIAAQVMTGSLSQRHGLLQANGPTFGDGASPPLPLGRMIHVLVALERSDIPARGGEMVADTDGDVDKSGVIIYRDAIYALHPSCGRTVEPVLPDITFEEAAAATLGHELGHTHQLGHDTSVGGGVNYYNLMSVPTSCSEAQMRAHGDGNSDPELGSTEEAFAPRFSRAAAELMDFGRIISVDTAFLDQENGYEM